MSELIERLDAEIARKRDREGDMLFLAPPDPLLTECKAALASLQANLNTRDTFIVSKGLWPEFVDSLPAALSPKQEDAAR